MYYKTWLCTVQLEGLFCALFTHLLTSLSSCWNDTEDWQTLNEWVWEDLDIFQVIFTTVKNRFQCIQNTQVILNEGMFFSEGCFLSQEEMHIPVLPPHQPRTTDCANQSHYFDVEEITLWLKWFTAPVFVLPCQSRVCEKVISWTTWVDTNHILTGIGSLLIRLYLAIFCGNTDSLIVIGWI